MVNAMAVIYAMELAILHDPPVVLNVCQVESCSCLSMSSHNFNRTWSVVSTTQNIRVISSQSMLGNMGKVRLQWINLGVAWSKDDNKISSQRTAQSFDLQLLL